MSEFTAPTPCDIRAGAARIAPLALVTPGLSAPALGVRAGA
jgi:hypothetical protein